MRTTPVCVLLVLGLFATGVFAPPRCVLLVDTADVVLTLSPASDYCGQTSVTIPSVSKSKCSNNGALCRNDHLVYKATLRRSCCVPDLATVQNITGDIEVSSGGCSKTVTYTFANFSQCECNLVGEVTGVY